MTDNQNFDEDDDFYDDEDLPTFNRWKLIGGALAVVIVAGFGVGIWYAYDQGVKKGVQLAPPIIKADTSDVKTVPKDKGGMDIPHQDKKVFNILEAEKEEEKVEKLMAPPEEAVREAPPVDVTETVREGGNKAAETLMKKTEEVAEKAKEKKEVVTQAIKEAVPDSSAGNTVKKETPKQLVQGAASADSTVLKAEKPLVKEKPAPKEVKAAAVKPAPKVKPASKSAAKDVVNFRVQLGAFRSSDAAEKAWTDLQKTHEALLGGMPHRVQSVEIKGKGMFHRLQAGAFADKIGASALCSELSARKQACLVARN